MKENGFKWLLDYFREKDPQKDSSAVTRLFCEETSKDDLRRLLSDQFDEIMSEKDEPGKSLDHILFRIHYNINSSVLKREKTSAIVLRWTARAAAIIILPLLVFWGIRGKVNYSRLGESYAEIHAPAWTRTRFILPDGSTGWLNSRSSLKYKVDFRNDRSVELAGEAYFDVEADPENPFVVQAGEISVMVHGTSFNVASWEDEDNIEVVLERGKIEVTRGDSDSSFLLSPNEMALYSRSGKKFSTEAVEAIKYLSWTEGKLVFRNDPPEVVARRLERWFNVDVEIAGSFDRDFRLRATFVDESLEEVLSILKKSLNIDYSIDQQGMDTIDTYGKKKVKIYIRN